jgi:hypothetical protein
VGYVCAVALFASRRPLYISSTKVKATLKNIKEKRSSVDEFPNRETHRLNFLKGGLLFGFLYVCFMAAVDIPMYWDRYVFQQSSDVQSLSFGEGIKETLRCLTVSQSSDVWAKEMPWMTGYFTFGVWSMLWLAQSDL